MSRYRFGPGEIPVMVKVGDLKVGTAGSTLLTLGLGSCVAVALYDALRKIGGLAHVLLPDPSHARSPGPPGRFASSAVDALLTMMIAEGADRSRIFARIAGGASMFENLAAAGTASLGARNVAAVKESLERARIPLRAQDVGGGFGRSVYFRLSDGRLLIRSIRRDDVIL